MGGERETTLDARDAKKDRKKTKADVTGGAGQKVRVHESGGEVHFHDDANSVKAAVPVADWWRAWERLRTQPGRWEWFDAAHGARLVVETLAADDAGAVEAAVTLVAARFGANYTALAGFTKR